MCKATSQSRTRGHITKSKYGMSSGGAKAQDGDGGMAIQFGGGDDGGGGGGLYLASS